MLFIVLCYPINMYATVMQGMKLNGFKLYKFDLVYLHVI